jgi:hypothetical protein
MKVLLVNLGKKDDNEVNLDTQEKLNVEMVNLTEKTVTKDLYTQVEQAYDSIVKDMKKPLWRQAIYIALRAPIIGLFFGFVVGFITVIRVGIFDTSTIIYVKSY